MRTLGKKEVRSAGTPPWRLLAVFLCAGIFPPRPAAAAVSAGGGYELEFSARDGGGGQLVSGGGYVSRAAIGQPSLSGERGDSSSAGYANRSGFYNPPHFTFQKGLPSSVAVSGARITLPDGALDKELFDITINSDPSALKTAAGVIDSANLKIARNEGAWARLLPGHISELEIFDEQSSWDAPLLKAGALSLKYRDEDSDGVLDGSSPPVRTEAVNAWVLDKDSAMWIKLQVSSRQPADRALTVPLLSSGIYSLLGTLDESVKDTYAFPVPFRPNGPGAGGGAGQSGTEADGITFANIPQAGRIEIYTLDGGLVRKLPIPSGLTIPKLKWDVRNSGGQRAASGVYIWRVVSGGNSKTGKLMVIW